MEWGHESNDQIDQSIDHFSALAAAAWARVCELIREVDHRQSWMGDGARNLVDWVAARLRVRPSLAAQLVGIAQRLETLPVLSERFETGDLSIDQVDAISRMATTETETGLIEEAMGLTNAALDRRSRQTRGISESDARSIHDRGSLYRQWNLDQSELRFGGRLPAEAGRIFDEAIDSRITDAAPDPETGLFDPYPQRAADALTELAAGDGGEASLTIFADITAMTDEGGSSELDNTALVPNDLARRLGCDGIVRTVIQDGAQPIGIGRRSRKVPEWLKELVYYRDGGQCQFPGCENTRWLQIHHVWHWADGGPTDLDNLILLCGAHHRFLHARGWHITTRDGRWEFRKSDWSLFPRPRQPLDPRLAQLVRSP